MADPTTPAPAASPAPASTPTPSTQATSPVTASPSSPSSNPTPAPDLSAPKVDRTKPIARGSNLITNPDPVANPDAPAADPLPATVPQSTIDEMNAGAEALKRNKPVASALEAARKAKEEQDAAAKG